MSYRKGPFNAGIINATPAIGGSATISANVAKYYVDEKGIMHINGYLTFTGGGAGATLSLTLPGGYSIDTNRIASGTDVSSTVAVPFVGESQWLDADAGVWKPIYSIYNAAKSIKFNQNSGVVLDNTVANGDGIKYNLQIPVV